MPKCLNVTICKCWLNLCSSGKVVIPSQAAALELQPQQQLVAVEQQQQQQQIVHIAAADRSLIAGWVTRMCGAHMCIDNIFSFQSPHHWTFGRESLFLDGCRHFPLLRSHLRHVQRVRGHNLRKQQQPSSDRGAEPLGGHQLGTYDTAIARKHSGGKRTIRRIRRSPYRQRPSRRKSK